ncbi:MAG: type II toxin-antitoxin system VapC family toxin, partial [Actinomycetota bacterium]|nr:type II toxin-antitoxin system VapC family toxin [Actinomycetota bacterium]
MILPDVNLLVLAHRGEMARHEEAHAWLQRVIEGDAAFGMSELVLSGVLRVVTNPRVFVEPTPPEQAAAFATFLIAQPHCVRLRPGLRHFDLFVELCARATARGNLVADAYHAALVIEHGCEWLTLDRDFARFPG